MHVAFFLMCVASVRRLANGWAELFVIQKQPKPSWLFPLFFIFTSLLGKMFRHVDDHFSTGLVHLPESTFSQKKTFPRVELWRQAVKTEQEQAKPKPNARNPKRDWSPKVSGTEQLV